MTTSDDERLTAAVATVDVMDLAGRIIANPRRAQVSLAGIVALAMATEKFWAVCLEAEILVGALAMPTEQFTRDEQFAVRDHAIETQARAVAQLMAELSGETNETNTSEQENVDGTHAG